MQHDEDFFLSTNYHLGGEELALHTKISMLCAPCAVTLSCDFPLSLSLSLFLIGTLAFSTHA